MWKIIDLLLNNLSLVISVCSALAFFIVNIILAIKNKDKKKLTEAFKFLPEVILQVEAISKSIDVDSLQKKAMAEVILEKKYGKFYIKNSQLFDDAIEDILKTPQKKGGFSDVSKENEEK